MKVSENCPLISDVALFKQLQGSPITPLGGTYRPPSGDYRYERTESPYEKYQARQLQKAQYKYYTEQNLCKIYYPPIMVEVEKKINQYIDYNNKVTSIWKLKDQELWTIVIHSSTDSFKKNSQSKGQET